MSLGQVSKTGAKVPIAGLNGLSGELVPSASYYQSGTTGVFYVEAKGLQVIDITLKSAMPDTDYVVNVRAAPNSQYARYILYTTNVSTTKFRVYVSNINEEASTSELPMTLEWQAFKLMTDESRALDEAAIAANTTALATVQSKAVSSIEGGSSKIWIKIEHLPYDAEMIVRCRGSDRYLLCTSSNSDKGVSLLRLLSGGTAEYLKIKEGRWDKTNAALYVYMESWFNPPTLLPLTNNTDVSSVTYTAVDTSSVPAVDNFSVFDVMGQVALNSELNTLSAVTPSKIDGYSSRQSYVKQGLVVTGQVQFWHGKSSGIASGDVLFTGFPPSASTYHIITLYDTDKAPFLFQVNTNGELIAQQALTKDSTIGGVFTYISTT